MKDVIIPVGGFRRGELPIIAALTHSKRSVFNQESTMTNTISLLFTLKPVSTHSALQFTVDVDQKAYLHNPQETLNKAFSDLDAQLTETANSLIPGSFDRLQQLVKLYQPYLSTGIDQLITLIEEGADYTGFSYRPNVGHDAVKYGYTLCVSIAGYQA
jgi:hypothetical protein